MDFLSKPGVSSKIITVLSVVLIALIIYQAMKKIKLNNVVAEIQKRSPDIMTLSYLGRTDLPRGVRNNNPGNLTRTAIPWQGKIGDDGRFEKFKSYVWGVRASIRDLRTDIEKKKLNTIRKLISSYAPPSENNTLNYINLLSSRTGYGPDMILSATAPVLKKLIQNITIQENGNPMSKIGSNQWISDEMFQAAYELEQA